MKDTEKKKQKLTLSIDPTVVKKAKSIGINISEITEEILRGFSFSPSGVETGALYEKYDQLFQTMLPLLKQCGTDLKVGAFYAGEFEDIVEIWLRATGGFYIPDFEQGFKEIDTIDINDFYPPKILLANFIEQISQSAKNRKQQLTELEMARKIIEAIGVTTTKKLTYSKGKSVKRDIQKRSNK